MTNRGVFADPHHCPRCSADLRGPSCDACGLRLVGPAASQLFQVNLDLDQVTDRLDALQRRREELLGERFNLIEHLAATSEVAGSHAGSLQPGVLHAEAIPAPPVLVGQSAVTATAPIAPPPPPGPGGSSWMPSLPEQQPSEIPSATNRFATLTLQTVLVSLGALLLGVAAIIFLAVSWALLGLTGRAVILTGITAGVLGGAALARRRQLPSTAEALGALGVLLIMLDILAARITGLVGSAVSDQTYLAGGALILAVTTGLVGLRLRLRTHTFTSAFATWLVPILTGWAIGHGIDHGRHGTVVGLAVSGALVLLLDPVTRHVGALEARMLRGLAVAAWLTTMFATWLPLDDIGTAQTAITAGLVALIGLGVSQVARAALVNRVVRRSFAAGAGWSFGVATVAAVGHLIANNHSATDYQPLIIAAILTAAAVAVSRLRDDAERPSLAAGLGIIPALIGIVALLASLVMAGLPLARVVLRPWSQRVTAVIPGFEAFTTSDRAQVVGVLVLMIAAVLAARWPIGWRQTRWSVAAVIASGLLLGLPYHPALPQGVSVAMALALGAGLILTSQVPRVRQVAGRGAQVLLIGGSLVVTVGVCVTWLSRPAAAVATVLGAAALAFARTQRARPVLTALAAAAAVFGVVGVLGWVGLDLRAAGWGAGCVAFLLLVLACAPLRLRGWRDEDRFHLAGVSAFAWLVGASVPWLAAGGHGWSDLRWLGSAVILLLAALLISLDPARVWPTMVRENAPGAVVLSAALVVAVGNDRFSAPWLPTGFLLALVQATGMIIAALWYRTSPGRALSVEIASGVVGLTGLVLGPSHVWRWASATVQAVGYAAMATRRNRSWAGAAVMGAAAVLLPKSDLQLTPELITVPSAIAVLLLGLYLRGRSNPLANGPLVAGLALLVVPPATVAVTGTMWRALACLALATVSLLLAFWVQRTNHVAHQRDWICLLLGLAVLVSLLGPYLRGVRLVLTSPQSPLEAWTVPAALVMVVALALWLRAGEHRFLPLLAAAPLLLAAAPTWSAGLSQHTGVRMLALQFVAGLLLLADAGGLLPDWLGSRNWRRPQPITMAALLVLALSLAGLPVIDWPLETLLILPAVALVGAGSGWMGRDLATRSWVLLGPGLCLGLVPSLVLTFNHDAVLRVILLGIVAALVVLVGSRLRWQAPIVIGTAVLAVHGLVQASPYLVLFFSVVPFWIVFGVLGVVLLVFGVTAERRVRDLVAISHRLTALR